MRSNLICSLLTDMANKSSDKIHKGEKPCGTADIAEREESLIKI